mmetsp:Transcript_5351/g.7714  ORF Transcript_5351/g.7714 Transcript_5351/m.7714 type:complete len:345 (+) Transcript_5351:84-1118(+)
MREPVINLTTFSICLWFGTLVFFLSNQELFRLKTSSSCEHNFHAIPSRIEDSHSKHALPHISWLMSFPNSGTSYTLRIVREVSNQTTATNYGFEHLFNNVSIPVNETWRDGPFLANISQDLPDHYILTKTHCGSRCVHCAPDGYLESQRTFQRACVRGNLNNHSAEVHYSAEIVRRAVHLFRNPLDNIVARFHLSRAHGNDKKFENNSSGFQKWCSQLDEKYTLYESHTPWIDASLLELWKDVPCHAEFFKYTQWHNLAWTTTQNLDIPSHILRYEDYAEDWRTTVDSIFSFLHLQGVAWEQATTFKARSYHSYYTPEQKDAIQRLIQNVASVPVWNVVKTYFT